MTNKNMRYRAFLIICLWCFVQIGCSSAILDGQTTQATSEQTILPTIPEDYFEILCENTEICFNACSITNNVCFTVITTAQELADSVEISFDESIPFTYTIEMEPSPSELPYSVFAAYQGVSWEKIAELYQNKDYDAIDEMCLKSLDSFQEMDTSAVSPLYIGKLTIAFPRERISGRKLTKLVMKLGGRTKEYQIGEILFLSDELLPDEEILSCDTLSCFDMNALPSEQGTFSVQELDYTATKSIVISDVLFYRDTAELTRVIMEKTDQDGNVTNFIWHGESVGLSKGEHLSLSIEGNSNVLKATCVGSCSEYLIVQYSCEEKEYDSSVELFYRMRLNPYELYAVKEDHLAYLPYYYYYVPLLMEEPI